MDPDYFTQDGWSDSSSVLTVNNILKYTNDQALITNALKIYERTLGGGEIDSMHVTRLFSQRYSNELTRCGSGNEAMARYFAKKLNLNSEVVRKWGEAKEYFGKDENGNKIYVDSYNKNICAAMELEKKMPDSARALFEKFGIANFARYDPMMLLRQLEMTDQDTPYGVVAFPESDYNGAFFQDKEQLKKIGGQLNQGGYEARIIEVASQLELAL